jgi:hypothetical protein
MTSIGRKVMSVGTILAATGLVRIQMLVRRANVAHPKEMANLLAHLGYAERSLEGSLMVVGYQYAVLRRPFLEMDGTSLERERNALLLWYVVFFTGVSLGIAGLVTEFLESRTF